MMNNPTRKQRYMEGALGNLEKDLPLADKIGSPRNLSGDRKVVPFLAMPIGVNKEVIR
jgi:hypothetical protein